MLKIIVTFISAITAVFFAIMAFHFTIILLANSINEKPDINLVVIDGILLVIGFIGAVVLTAFVCDEKS